MPTVRTCSDERPCTNCFADSGDCLGPAPGEDLMSSAAFPAHWNGDGEPRPGNPLLGKTEAEAFDAEMARAQDAATELARHLRRMGAHNATLPVTVDGRNYSIDIRWIPSTEPDSSQSKLL